VKLSRAGYKGDTPPAQVHVVVGTVHVDGKGGIGIGRELTDRRRIVPNGEEIPLLEIPVSRTPIRVELFVDPTFQASPSDSRLLGVQASFRFVPDGPS
jgi:hypothetical protein